MAFDPNFEKIVASVRKTLGTTQLQVESKLPTNNNVSKIYCSNAKVNITKVENVGREVNYVGFVNFQVIYQDDNNETMSVDYTAEFKEKYVADFDLNNVVPVISADVVDVNTVINGDIKAEAIVDVKIDGIVNNSTNVLTGINSDTYFTQKEIVSFTNYSSTVVERFEIVGDVEIKDSVSKVLSVCPSVYLSKLNQYDKYVNIEGGVNLNIVYLTDDNLLRSTLANIDFNQDVAQEDINETSFIQSMLQVLYNDIKVATNIDTDNAILNINLPMEFKGYVFKNLSTEVVSDLYSTSHFTNVTVESMQTLNPLETLFLDEKISGGVSIGDNDPFIDEVLGVCYNGVVIANSYVADNNFVIDGVASVNVLYLNKETNNVYSRLVEMPFSQNTGVDFTNDAKPILMVSMVDVVAKARRGRDIEVSATLVLKVDFYQNDDYAVITNVVEEDEIPENECAMSFYITKDGDTIWEIAKELRVSVDQLIAQNPSLSDPVPQGTRVVVYRQRQMEF